MHISDGLLSPNLVTVTSLAGAGVLGFSLEGARAEEMPKIALLTAMYCVGSAIHVPVGTVPVHLMLTGFIGLVAGRRTAIPIFVALLLQRFLLNYGGLSSLGANVLIQAVPAMLLGMALRPLLAWNRSGAVAFSCGFAAGLLSVAGSALLLGLTLIQSNRRFGMGPLSTVETNFLVHIPLMAVEALVTAFAMRLILAVRPEFSVAEIIQHERMYDEDATLRAPEDE